MQRIDNCAASWELAAIATWLGRDSEGFPEFLEERHEKVADLRYGENPHQSGAFYRRAGTGGPTLGAATQR